ncbi:RING-type E3 ubiquitin-protein ligase PPIL2, partial [Trichonephila inaurata madagascariensis]
MGKKQHQKDKMYLTATEWSQFYGGKKHVGNNAGSEFRRLPFDHCALSLQPFEHPFCTPEGVVYDLMILITNEISAVSDQHLFHPHSDYNSKKVHKTPE